MAKKTDSRSNGRADKNNSPILTLANTPTVDISAESFLEKQMNGSLTEEEVKWCEANVDAMVKSLYTDDEYNALIRAGYDPVMGIMVDGKPLEWFSSEDFITPSDTIKVSREPTDIAKQKCNVVGKVMNGSKIDLYKLVPDGADGYKKGEVHAVKTDLSMKTEKQSFFKRLLEMLGIIPSIKNNVNKANKARRGYLKTAMPVEKTEHSNSDGKKSKAKESEIAKFAKRDEAATRIKVAAEKDSRERAQFDKDFFADAFGVDIEADNQADVKKIIDKSAVNAFEFHDFLPDGLDKQGNVVYHSNSFLKTMNRDSSRVNMAILYGMTCGHSFDEMVEDSPEGAERRKAIGRAFVEELSVDDYDKFIQDHELENNEEGQKAFVNYVCDKREKLEKFTMRAVEAISREPITMLDPFDHTQFSQNFWKQRNIGMLAFDLFQSVAPLKAISVISTPETEALKQRSNDVFNYMTAKLNPVMNLAGNANLYASYMTCKGFVGLNEVGLNESMNAISVNSAAETKAAMSAIYSQTKDCKTCADIMYNDELNKSITMLTGQSLACLHSDNEAAAAEAYQYLQSENKGEKYITIDEEKATVSYKGFDNLKKEFEDYSMEAEDYLKKGTDAIKRLVDTQAVRNNGMQVSEAFDDKVRADKQTRNNVITFDDDVRKKIADRIKAATPKKQIEAGDKQAAEAEKTEKATAAEPKRLSIKDITEKPKIYEKPQAKKDDGIVAEKKSIQNSL